MKLLRPTLFVILLIQASFILAQDPVKETSKSASFEKKSMEMSETDKMKIRFVGLLKTAKDQKTPEQAHKYLVQANNICSEHNIESCSAKLDSEVSAIFEQWVATYQAQSDADQAKADLDKLQDLFCGGSLKNRVDCSKVERTLTSLSTENSREDYQKYIDQAKAARNLEDKLTALNKAEAICESILKDGCSNEISTLRKQAYTREFQTKVRHLRSANLNYSTQKDKLNELSQLIEKGDLARSYQEQYENLRFDIHEKEIDRLLGQNGDYDDQLDYIKEAREIDSEELDNALSGRIDRYAIEVVDDELDQMLSRPRRRGNFQRYLNQINNAEDLLDDLPESARNRRADRLRNFRRDVVSDELSDRLNQLDRTNDWRDALQGYNRLLDFASDYRDDLDRGTVTRLKREREGFLITEYEARLQQSLGLLQRNDLQGAQLALTGAVELSNTGFLPEGPAKYRHREVYQKIYEEHHRQLQLAKSQRNWAAAEQSIQSIDNLYQDAPFILVRASLEEELVLLDVAQFEAQMDEAGSVLRNRSLEEQYGFFNSLMDAYSQLRPHLNNAHRDQMGRLVFDLSKQPIDAARNAIQRENYALAINELAPLNQFLYQKDYADILPSRSYDELNKLSDHSFSRQAAVFAKSVGQIRSNSEEQRAIQELDQFGQAINDFQGWDSRNVKSELSNVYAILLNTKKQRTIEAMQAGRFDYEGNMDEMQRLQRAQAEFIPATRVQSIEQELAFYQAYEQGKTALRRSDFQLSMDFFQKAQTMITALPRNEQFEKSDLLLNGQRKSLEGLVLKQIRQNQNLGPSARRRAYKDIIKSTRVYSEVSLSEIGERALQDLELDWFGGACRTDYRKYTIHVLDAELAAQEEAYREALTLYQSALPFERRVERCMLPLDNVQKEIDFYSIAADFEQRKAKIDQLSSQRNWEQLDQAYTELWTAYVDFDIRQKFGYSMVPFGQYVLDQSDADLMYYFVKEHCIEDADLDFVKETLRQLSYRSSNSRMQTLGAEVAKQMYYQSPGKDYKSSFSYFVPNGKKDKSFKKFEKGYKKQWKTSWKRSR